MYTYIFMYRTRAIITRGFYILNPFLEGQKRFFKVFFFQKFLVLCMVNIQERVMMARIWYDITKTWGLAQDCFLQNAC